MKLSVMLAGGTAEIEQECGNTTLVWRSSLPTSPSSCLTSSRAWRELQESSALISLATNQGSFLPFRHSARVNVEGFSVSLLWWSYSETMKQALFALQG